MNIGGMRNVELARAIATWAHTGQMDKNGYDYINHPLSVYYYIFADDNEDHDGQIVALLHDVVEDTSVTLDDLRRFFPEYIVNAIDAITRRAGDQGDEYYERVKADPIAKRVKLADIRHNTSPKRMEKLAPATRERLIKKYQHALDALAV